MNPGIPKIVVSLILIASSAFADYSFLNHVEQIKDGVARVETTKGTFLGSGFFLNTEGILLTCAHVVQADGTPYDSVIVVNYMSVFEPRDSTVKDKLVKLSCEVLHVLPKWDLAILQVKRERYSYIRYPWAPLASSDMMREGKEVALCAFINDAFTLPRAFISKGIISTIRRNVHDPKLNNRIDIIEMDLTASKGTSGGPIFLARSGRVLAIMNSGIFESLKSKQTPYGIAILIDQVTPALDSLQIPYDIQ